MRAQSPDQPLGYHQLERGSQQITGNPQMPQTDQRVGGGIGMQGRQHQMAGLRRFDGNLCGFGIADFANHDHVRILTQQGAQYPAKSS